MRTALVALVVAMPAALPAHALAVSPPSLSVSGACLVEANSDQVLYTFNAEKPLAIASATKLMTALVVLERVKHLSTLFTQNNFVPAAEDSQIGLVPGEHMSVHDLLLAMMLPSADDAAEDLAYNVARGSIARFVGMMNAEARRLGLAHTHYSTPIGLDTPGNYSSPCDLVKLARYDLQSQPFFRQMVALPSATLLTGRIVRHVVNRDDLVGRVPWINGVKTGHTNDAGYVLVSSGTKDGMTMIGSVLGTSSETERDANALALLGYGVGNFHTVEPVHAGTVIARPTVKDRPGFHAPVIAGGSVKKVLARATKVTLRVELPHQLVGPLARHAVVGHVVVLGDGHPVATVPLLLAQRLPAVSKLAIAARFLTRTTTLLMIVAVVGLLIVLAVVRRERTRTREIVF